jgi:hypothetical protein
MKSPKRARTRQRVVISPQQLDHYLTAELHKVPGFAGVTVHAGYRLREPDADGCNWSGHAVPLHGVRAPPADVIEATLRPIVRNARARFNLSE